MDEMAFLRMRHVVSRELRDLQELGQHDGGAYTHETSITCKRKLRVAQDELQRLSATFSEMLVAALRKLNAFSVAKKIPEQDVTGMWKPFTPVPRELLAEFPPCTDWRRLLAEQRRLHYAAENYRDELVRVIRGCVLRGAKASPAIEALLSHAATYDGDSSCGSTRRGDSRAEAAAEVMSVEAVHRTYAQLKGYFEHCSRCLYPMAPKQTLVSMRLLWPKVQDTVFPERCRECMAGVQLSELMTTSMVVGSPMQGGGGGLAGGSASTPGGGGGAQMTATSGALSSSTTAVMRSAERIAPSSASRRRLSLSVGSPTLSLSHVLGSPSPKRLY